MVDSAAMWQYPRLFLPKLLMVEKWVENFTTFDVVILKKQTSMDSGKSIVR
ncbi:hypothetical protein [Massilibacteroides sp.]|uniref:hypothetical protein n=1 Tax=Massilibacteroides sp. TaxID=2034766 RepID=UPI00262A6F93|nr:hypothetical protein [Massilibacteroides sp.]